MNFCHIMMVVSNSCETVDGEIDMHIVTEIRYIVFS